MFSEITLIRPACARRPEVAMLIERAKSPPSFAMMPFPQVLILLLTLADRGLQKMQALAVERGHGGIVHLVGGNLEHLVFQCDGVAGGPGLENRLAVLLKGLSGSARLLDMRGAGAHHCQRSHCSSAAAVAFEFRLDQVARLEIRRVGIGDVFGEDALTLLVPLHLRTQR